MAEKSVTNIPQRGARGAGGEHGERGGEHGERGGEHGERGEGASYLLILPNWLIPSLTFM